MLELSLDHALGLAMAQNVWKIVVEMYAFRDGCRIGKDQMAGHLCTLAV